MIFLTSWHLLLNSVAHVSKDSHLRNLVASKFLRAQGCLSPHTPWHMNERMICSLTLASCCRKYVGLELQFQLWQ